MDWKRYLSCWALASVLLTACGSGGGGGNPGVPAGGGGGGGGGGAAPTDLSYPTPVQIFLVGVPIEPNLPVVTGTVDSWTVTPPLPAGLLLDGTSGAISGIPAGTVGRGVYTVHAVNDGGEATFPLTLEIVNPPRFAYVTNADDTISRFTVDLYTGAFRYDGFQNTPDGELGPRDLAVGPDRRFLYVTCFDTHNVSAYAIDPVNGELEPRTPVLAGSNPYGIAVTRSGAFAYVSNRQSNDVYAYRVEASGALTPIGAPAPTETEPTIITVDPTDRFVYVANSGSDSISVFTIQPDGTLVEDLGPIPVSGSGVRSIAIDPDGTYAYVVTQDDDHVIPYTIDRNTGELEAQLPARDTGDRPSFVAVHPTGKFTYVTNSTDGTISTYGVDADTGDLVGSGSVGTGVQPSHFDFDPSGTFAYVVNQGSKELTIFTVDGDTGALTSAGAVRARDPLFVDVVPGLGPVQQRARYAYVLNEGSRSIRSFRVENPSGELTFIDDIDTGLDPTGMAATPDGEMVFAIHEHNGIIVPYRVDPRTGDLRLSNFFELFNVELDTVTVDPSGSFLIVAGVVDPGGLAERRVITLLLDEDGVVQALSSAAVGTDPVDVCVDPTGQFVLVSSAGVSDDVRSFRVDSRTGELTPTGTTALAGGAPTDLAFHPSGQSALTTRPTADALGLIGVDANDGSLAAQPLAVGIPGGPAAVAIHPLGRFGYVAVEDPGGIGNVTVLNLSPTGVPLVSDALFDGLNPVALEFDPSGNHLYVVNRGSQDISVLTVDQDTGALTAGVAAPTAIDPTHIVIVREVE